jgi:predicted glutamine amidotransferase
VATRRTDAASVDDHDTDDLATGMRETLECLERLTHEGGGGGATTWANFCLVDGESTVATRYVSPPEAAAQSLYVGEAGSFVSDGTFCGTNEPAGDAATLIASEPPFDDDRVWRAVPQGHTVTVEPGGEVSTEPLDPAVRRRPISSCCRTR